MDFEDDALTENLRRRHQSHRPYYDTCLCNSCAVHDHHRSAHVPHPAQAPHAPLAGPSAIRNSLVSRQRQLVAATRVTSPKLPPTLYAQTGPTRSAGSTFQSHRDPARARHLHRNPYPSDDTTLQGRDIPNTHFGRLSSNFQANRSRECFTIGTVFYAPWSEQAGAFSKAEYMVRNSLGIWIFSKIRLFVVIRVNHNNCVCMPIQTYGGRGPGSRFRGNHSFVYTDSNPPLGYERTTGEPAMGANIRIEPNAQWKTLRANSCIDYTKAYTVEDYVPTFILGRVHSNDFNKFIEEYRSRDSTYCQFNDIRSDRRPVVSSPASDNVVPRRFETMREFCSLNQHAVDQAFNRAPSADAFFEALKDLQSSVAFEDSTNPWIDTGPTLPDLANNCPNQIAANEDQAPHAMHGSSNNVVFNWPSYREGLAAARQDIRQAGDDQTLHGDGVYPQPEAHQTNPTLSTL